MADWPRVPREAKFRAKDHTSKQWIYAHGYYYDDFNYWFLLPHPDNHNLASVQSKIIEPETLGEFIGKRDKNQRNIYEGDIVIPTKPEHSMAPMYRVIWVAVTSRFAFQAVDTYRYGAAEWNPDEDVEIVGNITDNPALLKVEVQSG